MAVYGKKAQEERYGASGEEGYKRERASIEAGMAKQLKRKPEETKRYIDTEMAARIKQDSIEDHIKSISKGRGPGIPDNYKKKEK